MLAQSFEEVMAESKREGKLEGKLEGQLEGKRQTAVNLLKEGSDIDFVSRITGLSKEEVRNLSMNMEL